MVCHNHITDSDKLLTLLVFVALDVTWAYRCATRVTGTAGKLRLAYAATGVPFKPLRMLHKNVSSQPVRLSFMECDPFEVSCLKISKARLRRTAMLPGALLMQMVIMVKYAC